MKILFFDIETAPALGYFWDSRLYEQDIIEVKDDSFILGFGYCWNHLEKIHWVGQPDFPAYKRDKKNDMGVVKALWKLIDEADVVVAHNGKSFDVKKANTRFILLGLPPPNQPKIIDTKLIARKYFSFPSNKLDELSRQLEESRKLPHTGKKLWFDCMAGDEKAWATMERYCKQDVNLLRNRYKDFLGWIDGHPNWNLYDDRPPSCNNCGSAQIHKAGLRYNMTTVQQKFRCRRCKAFVKGKIIKRANLK